MTERLSFSHTKGPHPVLPGGGLWRSIPEKEEDGVWNVSGPRLERVFDINKLNTEEDFYLFANKMRYLGIDTALREAGCQDGDTVRLLGFEFEFIEN